MNNNKPDLFIVDMKLKLKKKLLLNSLFKKRKTYLITKKINVKKSLVYKKLGYKIILIDQLNDKNDFNSLSKRIYNMGYSRLLIESGLTFLNYLLKYKLINELYFFKSSHKLGKNGKNNDTLFHLKKINPKLLTINLINYKLLKKEF